MKNLLIMALMVLPFAMMAQNDNEMKEERHVEVTGVAEMEIIPNEIYIALTLQEEKDGQKRSVEDQESTMIKKIKKLGIDIDNLKLSNVGSYTRWDKKTSESYKQKSFELKVEDAAKASELMYELQQLEIYRMNVSRTDHSDIEKFRKEVKIDAVKAAKDKAIYLLEAVDEQVGDIIYIKEQEYGGMPMYRAMGVSNMMTESTGAYSPDSDITFQPVKLQYKIIARFAIK